LRIGPETTARWEATRHPVVRDGPEGVGSMDQVKRTYRTVKTDLRKTARGSDGTDL
jgi:hypothetical protein